MNEADLHFFIDSIVNYFKEVSKEKAITGIPYIKGDKHVALEYTAIIGISGKRKGSIYFTANAEMLKKLAYIIIGLQEVSTLEIKDLIGEIANTISGNVRQAYGSDFMISVPVVIDGDLRDIKFPNKIRSFVIPVNWKNFQSFLVVCLE